MTGNITTEIQGVDKLIQRLSRVASNQYMTGTMQVATDVLRTEIAVYPPATDANQPMARRWYERGFGPRWMLRNGQIRGRRTSETLGRRWTTRVTNGGMTGIVGNNASYAPFVQSARQQSRVMARIGWKTDEEAARKQAPKIVQLFKDAIERALG